MKNKIFNLFFSIVLAIFSLIWISDKLAVLIENIEYDYVEMSEKGETENNTENKLKTLFLDATEHSNVAFGLLPKVKNSTAFYSFSVKEFCFENQTPPPEMVQL